MCLSYLLFIALLANLLQETATGLWYIHWKSILKWPRRQHFGARDVHCTKYLHTTWSVTYLARHIINNVVNNLSMLVACWRIDFSTLCSWSKLFIFVEYLTYWSNIDSYMIWSFCLEGKCGIQNWPSIYFKTNVN